MEERNQQALDLPGASDGLVGWLFTPRESLLVCESVSKIQG